MISQNNSIKAKIQCRGPVRLTKTTRTGLKDYFENAWNIYEQIFGSIKEENTYLLAPDPLRNPLIFYYGHTAAFYINKLLLGGLIKSGVNPRFEVLFAKGVDPELPEHLGHEVKWPSLGEVAAYREKVYEIVSGTIDKMEIPTQIISTDPAWDLLMAIEHDLIHFETSSVLIRQLDEVLVEKPEGWHYAPSFGFSEEFKLIPIKGGRVNLGKKEPAELFGWDNEFGSLEVDVKPFSASKNMITNGEFINFVKNGAYENDRFWSEDALVWKSRTDTRLPKFWVKDGDTYKYRAMFDIIDMPLDWPVEVNAFEALAYCKFKGPEFRLLSEAEFRLLTNKVYGNMEPAFSDKLNLNMKFGSPSPVGYFESKEGDLFNDLYGNVWDWLSDSFYPLPGFRIHEHYPDFSEPYFDDKHKMLLGGSWSTSGAGASQYYRLWFREYFYQHAGFRLARNGTK